jgi:hypothetical protein
LDVKTDCVKKENIFIPLRKFSIIRVIKSRRRRWAGHAARMGRGGMHIGY